MSLVNMYFVKSQTL